VTDKVSHPYKATGKIIVLYILIFTFQDSRREDKIFHVLSIENGGRFKIFKFRFKFTTFNLTRIDYFSLKDRKHLFCCAVLWLTYHIKIYELLLNKALYIKIILTFNKRWCSETTCYFEILEEHWVLKQKGRI
jgi:hypothetical protein